MRTHTSQDTLAAAVAQPLDPHELRPGDMAGEYRITAKIGEGGFGSVYAAEHPLIGKHAAIKVLSFACSSQPEIVSRFAAEARAVNRITHSNIIDVFAFGALDDGRQWLAMELLEGQTLLERLDEAGRLDIDDALAILWPLARALDAAHEAGVVHRDIKPENVFLVFDPDESVCPKLLDFGIAKLLDDQSRAHKTRTGAALGTPHYMSPEQCAGSHIDAKSDIYSFGVLVFELLTGVLPFDAESALDVIIQHRMLPPPSMLSVCPALVPALDAPVMAMLAKDPSARPSTLCDAMVALALAAAVSVEAASVSEPAPASELLSDADTLLVPVVDLPATRPAQRRRRGVLFAMLALVAAGSLALSVPAGLNVADGASASLHAMPALASTAARSAPPRQATPKPALKAGQAAAGQTPADVRTPRPERIRVVKQDEPLPYDLASPF